MSVFAITAAGAGAGSLVIAQAPVPSATAAAGIYDFYILAGATKPPLSGSPTFTIPPNFASSATNSGVFPSGGGGGSIGAPGGGNGNGRSTPLSRLKREIRLAILRERNPGAVSAFLDGARLAFEESLARFDRREITERQFRREFVLY